MDADDPHGDAPRFDDGNPPALLEPMDGDPHLIRPVAASAGTGPETVDHSVVPDQAAGFSQDVFDPVLHPDPFAPLTGFTGLPVFGPGSHPPVAIPGRVLFDGWRAHILGATGVQPAVAIPAIEVRSPSTPDGPEVTLDPDPVREGGQFRHLGPVTRRSLRFDIQRMPGPPVPTGQLGYVLVPDT